MITLLRAVFLLGFLFLAGPGTPPSAELVTLSPQSWERFAPEGKEVDAIYGDFVIRNQEIVAVLAHPVEGRHANMMVRDVAGCLIDLTRRHRPSDQLGAYYPVAGQFKLRFAGVESRGASVYDTSDPRNLYVRADEVVLHLVGEPVPGNPDVDVRYRLGKTWPYLRIETVYSNPGDQPLRFAVLDSVRADRSNDLKTPEVAPDGRHPLFWIYDPWFGQAYGVQCQDREIYSVTESGRRSPSQLSCLEGGTREVELQPGGKLEVVRFVFPGSDLFEVRAVANRLNGEPQKAVTLRVKDGNGPVSDAEVEVLQDGRRYAWGRTGGDGQVHMHLPAGSYQATVSALGRPPASLNIDPSVAVDYSVDVASAGYVRGFIRDENGKGIPAKVQFRGTGGTPDPFFGPDSGEHAVHNLYYTADGRFRQALAPGSYQVIVSRGPEYDAVFSDLQVRPGQESSLDVTLVRSVNTPGWVSSDFHSHSSPSGDNTSSQLGRVLNLLAEHIEFAPCTEHNRISSYVPHLQRLGAAEQMATCSGIELTSSPLPLNHQNAFPLVWRPHFQDGGGPPTSPDPEVQIERLALWDQGSEKVVQVNHPDIGWMFFDRDGDRRPDRGYSRMFGFIDVIEVHPPADIFAPPVLKTASGEETNNRIFNWLQLLNRGFRIPGVVNTDAHANFHGSGFLRNYVKSPTDHPGQIQTSDIVKATEQGNLVMSNGPFLEVYLEVPGREGPQATAGDEVAAPAGRVHLHLRVQCPNWFDVDRVQVFLNGRAEGRLNFTRGSHPSLFSTGTVRFEHTFPVELAGDTHLIVATIGENSALGPVAGPTHETDLPVALSNPIFVDVDGGGFQTNGDLLGAELPVKAGR